MARGKGTKEKETEGIEPLLTALLISVHISRGERGKKSRALRSELMSSLHIPPALRLASRPLGESEMVRVMHPAAVDRGT